MSEDRPEIFRKAAEALTGMAALLYTGVRDADTPDTWRKLDLLLRLHQFTKPDEGVVRPYADRGAGLIVVLRDPGRWAADPGDWYVVLADGCPCGGGPVDVDGDGFRCPAGCRYGRLGERLSGATPRGLDRRPTQVRDERGLPALYYDTARVVPGAGG